MTCHNNQGEPDPVFEEHEDRVVINGVIMQKPFVEKPANTEDHKVTIYNHPLQGSWIHFALCETN
jgi:hypothetical protein